MTTVSIILYICGDEDVDTVLATAKSMALCDVYEAAAICADNCDVYREALEKLGIAFADASGRDYSTISQFKNAAISYTSGDYMIYIAPGEIIDDGIISRLMTPEDYRCLTLPELIEKGAGRLERIAISR